MAQSPNDDLFESTTMTFGEHLEELRTALFKSLIALVLGMLIGLVVAEYVVGVIKGPLEEALTKYYRETATEDLLEEYDGAGGVPPEMVAMIEDARLVPDSINVDPFAFLEALKAEYPDQFDAIELSRYVFVVDDVKAGQGPSLCRALRAGSEMDDAKPGRRVWQLLEPTARSRVGPLTEKDRLSDVERAEVVAILNGLLAQRVLHESKAFDGLEFISDDDLRKRFKTDRAALAESFDAEDSRRLNRQLLARLYSKQLRRPRLNVVELPTWKRMNVRVQTLSAQEAFMIWLKAAFIAGALVASPYIFWQIWNFVAAGLYPHEKKYVHIYLPFSLILFMAGAALAFNFVFGPVLDFLFGFNDKLNIDPDPRISEWLGFVLFLPLGFGISFQLPLVMLFLHRIGLFTTQVYLSRIRIAILVIFVISMLLTPADPISMLLMALPLTALYFFGVALCKWMPRNRNPFADAYEP